LVVAWIITKIVNKILEAVKFEEAIQVLELREAMRGVSATHLIDVLLKVYIVLVFLGAAVAYVNVNFLAQVLYQLVTYIPSLVKGVLVIIGAIIVAYYASRALKAANFFMANQLALVLKLFLLYLGVVLALPFFLPGVDTTVLVSVLQLLVSAIVIAVGLGLGLAVGLGLKDAIAKAAGKNQDVFDEMFEKVKRH
jgi:hypothetical protein